MRYTSPGRRPIETTTEKNHHPRSPSLVEHTVWQIANRSLPPLCVRIENVRTKLIKAFCARSIDCSLCARLIDDLFRQLVSICFIICGEMGWPTECRWRVSYWQYDPIKQRSFDGFISHFSFFFLFLALALSRHFSSSIESWQETNAHVAPFELISPLALFFSWTPPLVSTCLFD